MRAAADLSATMLPVCLALLVPAIAHADVVINETRVDVKGTDTGYEYVELYNSGDTVVDLSGWQLLGGTTSLSLKATLPDGTTLAPGGFLVLGEDQVPEADIVTDTLTLGNASSNGDAVAIADASGVVLDILVYGPDDGGFTDESGGPPSPAPAANEDLALGRKVDGVDTNVNSADFEEQVPTPGSTNSAPVATCDGALDGAGVVINEFLYDADGSDGDSEWLEILNASGRAVDVSGWQVQAASSDYGSQLTFPEATTLRAGEFVLVGGANIAGRDYTLPGSGSGDLPNAGSSGDAVRLVDCVGDPVDTVIYGADNADGFRDDTGEVATRTAPKVSGGSSLARRRDGVDTDDSAADFIEQGPQTISPGAPNPEPPPCELGDIVINEFLPDPDGADGEAAAEWVELYNAGDTALTVAGWMLEYDGTEFGGSGLELDDVVIPAGGYLLIGQENVEGADLLLDVSLGNGSGGDGLRLYDCEGGVVDTVIYGPPNDAGFPDDTGEITDSVAPKPSTDASVARIQDGYDTDRCGEDFVVDSAPTPGAANPTREPIVCVPAAGDTVVLNEALVDAEGGDEGYEWIELYNPTDAPISVAGWGVAEAASGEEQGSITARIGGGVEVPAGGFLVFGGALVDEVEVEVPLSLGNGSGGDSIVLLDCEGTRIDSVLYGSDNEDLHTDDLGLTPDSMYIDSISSGRTLARIEDGVDSDSAADWFSDSSPTPGATNVQEAGTQPEPRGCNCRDDSEPEVGEPETGCGDAEPPPALAGLALLLGLGALGRRRRRS